MNHLIVFILSVITGSTFTWLARSFAWKYHIVNRPNIIVPQHTQPIAYLGGIGICLGVIVFSIVTFSSLSVEDYWFGGLAILFTILGVVDDIIDLSPLIKLVFQLTLASIASFTCVQYAFTRIEVIDYLLTVLWILVLINAYNLTDVCDGLVGGLGIISFMAIYFFGGTDDIIALLFSGSILGFLVYNAPPASIFMGDAGSLLLGFVAAYLSLNTSSTEGILDFIPFAVLNGVVLFELFFLVLIRVKKGLKWWLGSPDHISLRLQKIGLTKWNSNFTLWTFSALCCIPLITSNFSRNTTLTNISSLIIVCGSFSAFGLFLLKKENEQSKTT